MKKVFLAVLIFSMLAQNSAQAGMKFIKNNPGDLKVTVFVTDTLKSFEDWMTTSYEYGPRIERIHKVAPDQLVYAGFLITGYMTDENSHVNYRVRIKVIDPNGEVAFEDDEWAIGDGKAEKQGFIMAKNALDILIEKGDPLGEYQIQATVYDRIAESEASHSFSFSINVSNE